VVALAWAASAMGQGVSASEVREDFEKAEVGPVPASLMIIDGGWVVAEAETGGKVLELQSEPVVDGVVLVGPSMKEGAVVSAKIKAGKSRRADGRWVVWRFRREMPSGAGAENFGVGEWGGGGGRRSGLCRMEGGCLVAV
jgi:hypothetical protein